MLVVLPGAGPSDSRSRGRTSAICSGVIPEREYEEPRNRGRQVFILNKVLLEVPSEFARNLLWRVATSGQRAGVLLLFVAQS